VYAACGRESDVVQDALATDPFFDLGSEPFGLWDQLPGGEHGALVLWRAGQEPVVRRPELTLGTGGLDRNRCEE
jgi:hypothetical protein